MPLAVGPLTRDFDEAAVVAVTVYSVIGAPPSLAGAVKATVAWPLPAVTVIPVGASGAVEGVTGVDAVEATLVPALFVAVTVKV